MNEVWKDIPNFEGIYQVSNLGRIKSLGKEKYSYNCKVKREILIKKRDKILKGYYDKDGYKRMCLYKDNKRYYPFVHRIVAQTFIPNPNNYPIINHKNEIKDDNNIFNLEWCDIKYNNNYGNRNKKISIHHSRKVAQYSLDMKLIKNFSSITDAAKELKTSTSHISRCCKGKLKTTKGYIWKYV